MSFFKRRKAASRGPTYCQICGSTKGPFAAEPFPVKTAKVPMFNRCRLCATDRNRGLYHLNLKDILKDRFGYVFVECEGCGGPFWTTTPGVAYAWERFDVDSCPVCGTALPQGEAAGPRSTEDDLMMVYMDERPADWDFTEGLESLRKGIAANPGLAKRVDRVVYGTRRGDRQELAVIGHGLSDADRVKLRKMTDGSLSFSGSRRVKDFDDLLEREDLTVVDEWSPVAT